VKFKQKYTRLMLVVICSVVVSFTMYWTGYLYSSAQEPVIKDESGIHIKIQLTEWEISPVDIAVDKGETVHLTVVNKGAYPHDFVINEINLMTKTLSVGQEETLTFVAEQPMTLESYCSLPGHREAGMVGTLSIK
jgi:uncharacterized cupredoxin-like copper-binding protein